MAVKRPPTVIETPIVEETDDEFELDVYDGHYFYWIQDSGKLIKLSRS